MKKKWLFLICMAVVPFLMTSGIVRAASCEGVNTAIINCDPGESGIGHILKLVIDIGSIGVGVLAAVGIVVVGIQYLTAGGNEEQVRKSKRRLVELVIGLAVFVVGYGLISWLMPSGVTNPEDLPHYDAPDVPEPTPTPGGSGGGSGGSGSGGGGSGEQTAKKCGAFNDWIDVNVGTIRGYYVNIPQGADETTPIMIYLHGCGQANESAGRDYGDPLDGLQSVKSMRGSSQFISIIPHSVTTGGCSSEWSEDVIKNIIEGASDVGKAVSEKLSSCGGASNRKKYIMGMSDGAIGTWKTVNKYPNLFVTAAPVAAGVDLAYLNMASFGHTRIVGIIGSLDYDHMYIKTDVGAVDKAHPEMNPMLVIYNGLNHNNITANIKYDQLFNCMLSSSNLSLACATFANSGK